MSSTRSAGHWLGMGLTAGLLLLLGCARTGTNARSVASATVPSGEYPGDPAGPPNELFAADDPNAIPVSSTIKKVTVYSDRALVSREAAVKVTGVSTVYVFRQLPGWGSR